MSLQDPSLFIESSPENWTPSQAEQVCWKRVWPKATDSVSKNTGSSQVTVATGTESSVAK